MLQKAAARRSGNMVCETLPNIAARPAFTIDKDSADDCRIESSASVAQRALQQKKARVMLSSVVKCVFWLSITLLAVFGKQARPPAADSSSSKTQVVTRARHLEPSSRAPSNASHSSSSASASGDIFSGLAEKAAAKLVGAAREQCLAHPIDCISAAERFSQASAKSDSSRR
jgi:hypothetical protein